MPLVQYYTPPGYIQGRWRQESLPDLAILRAFLSVRTTQILVKSGSRLPARPSSFL